MTLWTASLGCDLAAPGCWTFLWAASKITAVWYIYPAVSTAGREPTRCPCVHLVSRASRIFLYFRWEEREGEKNTSGHSGQLPVPRRNVIMADLHLGSRDYCHTSLGVSTFSFSIQNVWEMTTVVYKIACHSCTACPPAIVLRLLQTL